MPITLEARYFRSVVDGEGEVGHASESLVMDPASTALMLVDVYSDVQDQDATTGGIRKNQSRTEWIIVWLEDVIGYTVTTEEFVAACQRSND